MRHVREREKVQEMTEGWNMYIKGAEKRSEKRRQKDKSYKRVVEEIDY